MKEKPCLLAVPYDNEHIFSWIWYKVLSRNMMDLQKKSFNLRRLLQLSILATFLFSWSAAANATVICECEEGHITVENIYTGYCDIDFNHDHGASGHADISCNCEDTAIQMGISNTAKKLDFNFNYPEPIIKTDFEYKTSSPDQNYISQILNKNRLRFSNADQLKTIILLI